MQEREKARSQVAAGAISEEGYQAALQRQQGMANLFSTGNQWRRMFTGLRLPIHWRT